MDTETWGRCLLLDGVIQLTERDECAYQEMITHLPMMCHPAPRSVLIVGGGDGGVLREVARHADVERIVMCDIDRRVVELAREFLADVTATAFEDKRLELLHEDAAAFLARETGAFDVIIVDSTDPVGPAESLFTPEFYASLHAALTPTGVIATQGECMWLHLDLIKDVLASTRALFTDAAYARAGVPTYPAGQIGFILATKSADVKLQAPARAVPADLQAQLKFYDADMHKASFVLPPFVKRALGTA